MTSIKFPKYASVILDVALDKTLDYGVPEDMSDKIYRGMRVVVPLRGREQYGYVYEVKNTPEYNRVLPIKKITSDCELITDELFELALWMAKYYCAPLSSVLKVMFPSSVRGEMKHKEQLYVMRAKTRDEMVEYAANIRNKHTSQAEVLDVMLQVSKGILLTELLEETGGSRSPVDTLVKKGYLAIDIVRIDRSPLINEEYFQTKAKRLNADQAVALKKISQSLQERRFETHLLFGITGSGKTEVYLQAIEEALEKDLGTIMLVPEIALTGQTIERFRSRFEGNIAILHHRLSHGERFDEWHKIRQGKARIVIGARSAIFSPVPKLGLIIIDEEHEQSYKQSEEAPCYHARDVAVMRGKICSATVILGSATPSLESYYNASQGKYTLSKLTGRAEASQLPTVTIVDMQKEFEKAKGYTNFSDALLSGIKRRQQDGEQTILFLNRRGYHTVLLCRQCGEGIRCKHCDVALTFHKSSTCLSCHLCGYTLSPPPTTCPKCAAPDPMQFKGVGTEQVEKSLHAVLPETRTIRLDADTTRHKGSHHKMLREFGTGKADVMIGTQMIAKGLHFPGVTLVGVLNSDAALNIPDFRASETVFQLITQVSGRAGRGSMAGEVIIQTRMPDNRTIQLASKQDYETFYHEEIAIRELFGYPPLKSIVKITLSGPDERRVLEVGEGLREGICRQLPQDYEIHPVTPSGYAKVKDKFRFQFLIRGPAIYPINRAILGARKAAGIPSTVKVHIDVNPSSTYF